MTTAPQVINFDQDAARMIADLALAGMKKQIDTICKFWYTGVSQDPFPVTLEEYHRSGASRENQYGTSLKLELNDYLEAKRMCFNYYEVTNLSEFSHFEYLLGVLQSAMDELNTSFLTHFEQYQKGYRDGQALLDYFLGGRGEIERAKQVESRLYRLAGISSPEEIAEQEKEMKQAFLVMSGLALAQLAAIILWGYKGVAVVATCDLFYFGLYKKVPGIWIWVATKSGMICSAIWLAGIVAKKIAGG